MQTTAFLFFLSIYLLCTLQIYFGHPGFCLFPFLLPPTTGIVLASVECLPGADSRTPPLPPPWQVPQLCSVFAFFALNPGALGATLCCWYSMVLSRLSPEPVCTLCILDGCMYRHIPGWSHLQACPAGPFAAISPQDAALATLAPLHSRLFVHRGVKWNQHSPLLQKVSSV